MIESDSLPTISGDRVRLRALSSGDLEALYAIFSDAEVMRYWSHAPFSDIAEAESYLADIRRGVMSRSLFQWGLCRSEDDRVIGTCTLWQFDAANRRCEIGFALAREHWGGGWMSEGLTVLIDYTFSQLGLLRLEADVDPRNAASITLLERLGFEREGYMRERWLVEGKTADSVFYGLLAKDWLSDRSST
ncbi:MAG: GNAT family N-acetyltransferase [Thermoanaerobaculia bacterium]